MRLLVFILHSLFLDKEPILLSAKAKGRAPVNCFMDICIMLNDWGYFKVNFLFSRRGLLSYQRKEQEWREKDYQKKELSFHVRTLWLYYRLVPGEAALKEGRSKEREKLLTKDGIGRI